MESSPYVTSRFLCIMYIYVASAPIDQPEVWGSAQPESPSLESPNLPRPFPAGSKCKYLLFEKKLSPSFYTL